MEPAGRFAFSPLVVDNVMYVVGKDSAVYEVNGRQFVAFYGSNVDRPGEGNIAWEGGAEGSQGYYVFALP